MTNEAPAMLIRPLLVLLTFGALTWPVAAQPTRPAAFPQVTLVGSAGPDRPYRLETVTVGSKSFDSEHLAEATAEALRTSGWSKASQKSREKLALDWCIQVLLNTQTPLTREPAAFRAAHHPFHAPQARTRDGKVLVQIWLEQPGSMMGPGRGYQRLSWTFDSHGQMSWGKPERWVP